MSGQVPETGRTDRLPPYSEEAERGVLGSMLLAPERVIGAVAKMGVCEASFYVPAHRTLFAQMMAMAGAGRQIDLVTLPQWCRDRGVFDQVGGDRAIESMIDMVPHDGRNAVEYAAIVQDKFMRRQLIDRARATIDDCYYGEDDTKSVVSRAMAGIQGLADGVFTEKRSNAEVFDAKFANWSRAFESRQSGMPYLPGLPTSFRRYDELLGGRQMGLHLIGGKSSSGKTTMVLNEIREDMLNNKPVLVIQLDDTHDDMIGRLVSMMSNVSLPALEQGFGKHDNLAAAKDVRDFIAKMPLFVEEECSDVREAAAMARYHRAKHGIEKLVIDYVQVLDADGNPRDDERIRLGKIAAACKRLWKELRIPVVLVSQTAKTKDYEDDGMVADMSDLFGASELYHVASTVTIVKHVRMKASKLVEIYQKAGLSVLVDEINQWCMTGKELVKVEMPIDQTMHSRRQAVAAHVVKNKHGAKGISMMWALLKYFQLRETDMVERGGIIRQQTWEEELLAMGGG